MLKKNGGILAMIFAVIGIVAWVTIFESVMDYLALLILVPGVEDLLLFTLVVGFAPTILLIGGIAGASFAYIKGYQSLEAKDANGLMRMIMGAITLVIFIAVFSNIATVFSTLYTDYGGLPEFPIFGLTCSIVPTILFLGGITASIGTAVGGALARRRRSA